MHDPLFIRVGWSRSFLELADERSWEIRHLRTFLLAVSSYSHGIFFRAVCQFLQRYAFLFKKLPLWILRRK